MFKELWILENPIETKISNLKFIKVKEYEKLLLLSSILQIDKQKSIQFIKDNYNNIPEIDQVVESLNISPFIQIIKEVQWLGLYDGYTSLFDFCSENKGCFDLIESDEELKFYVDLIKEMNCIEFEKENPNPELAYYDRLERIAREKKGEVITFKSMITNVGLWMGRDVLDISIYSLHEYFNAIATNKNYDTAILYQTVSTEQLQIVPWYADMTIKKTQLSENDKAYIGRHLAMVKDDPIKNKSGIIKDIDNNFKL